ncbi:hypothetical protein COCSADRAFT_358353 [Bipolaris sorokiniana ND90Pr]|uniref:Uncharacterized protein n=1 Tax=Cochliobolus sativus (strain ND90Pr / ATCC 201652) TaxID=665912 RepID=M2S907_COCSN|nr:uncharacterized protein COCSADRAFT_358353 [Bipolaris sorokiniana ND90Pr]EMD63833.1 hypothetical protein COCSADRAFT_358353 [Bipolaris sorokiniana ND90Pr]
MAAALPIALYDLHSGIYIPPVGPARVVATVRQKTISRLKRLFPQLFALSNPGPPNLSLEIILMIAEYFDKCTLRLECKKDPDRRFCFPFCGYIPYHHMRLVMNRHFYGPEHGLPLQALSERQNYQTHEYEVECSISQHARIFGDELLVLTVISMTQLRGDLVLLRSHVESFGGSVCQHLTISQRSPVCIPIQFPELAKKGNASGSFPACGPMYGSCTSCLTYYSINITWQGLEKGYSIEVLVYRGLGDCRTPESWYWRTMARWDPSEKSRSAYSPHNPPGSIRDRWDEAGGVAEITDGAWRRASRAAGLG